MFGSRFRSSVVLLSVGILLVGASACSKKDNTTSTGSSSVSSTTAAGGAGTTVKAAKKNPCGEWPAASSGMPEAIKKPDSVGYFVWQDAGGWHLRARGAGKDPFKGTIRGSRDLSSVKEFPDNGGSKLELKGNVLTFEIPASSDSKGFDLIAGCQTDQLQFALLVGAQPAPADMIYVGPNSKALNAVFVEQKG